MVIHLIYVLCQFAFSPLFCVQQDKTPFQVSGDNINYSAVSTEFLAAGHWKDEKIYGWEKKKKVYSVDSTVPIPSTH